MPAQGSIPFEVLAIVVLCGVCVIVLSAYNKLLREFRKIISEKDNIGLKTREKTTKILEDAQEGALKILAGVKVEVEEKENALSQEMHKLTVEEMQEYKLMLQKVSKDIEISVLRELNNFDNELKKQTIEAEKDMNSKFDKQFQQLMKEIDKYREDKYKQMESDVRKTLIQITEKVLGKSIILEDHQELIIKALEEAKQKHAF